MVKTITPEAEDTLGSLLEGQLEATTPESEADGYFSLTSSPQDEGAYFALERTYDQGGTRILEGAEAMRFLGLPSRPLNYLRVGDVQLIEDRFSSLIKRLRRRNEDPDALFWDKISIRVWNKANVAVLTPTEIRGRVGKPRLPNVSPAEYVGDLMLGRAIVQFLSDVRTSDKWRDYFVQVVSVQVTEDMAGYGQL